jgi:hypothetical protein
MVYRRPEARGDRTPWDQPGQRGRRKGPSSPVADGRRAASIGRLPGQASAACNSDRGKADDPVDRRSGQRRLRRPQPCLPKNRSTKSWNGCSLKKRGCELSSTMRTTVCGFSSLTVALHHKQGSPCVPSFCPPPSAARPRVRRRRRQTARYGKSSQRKKCAFARVQGESRTGNFALCVKGEISCAPSNAASRPAASARDQVQQPGGQPSFARLPWNTFGNHADLLDRQREAQRAFGEVGPQLDRVVSALYRQRRTLIMSNLSPLKTICFTAVLPLSLSRFR